MEFDIQSQLLSGFLCYPIQVHMFRSDKSHVIQEGLVHCIHSPWGVKE